MTVDDGHDRRVAFGGEGEDGLPVPGMAPGIEHRQPLGAGEDHCVPVRFTARRDAAGDQPDALGDALGPWRRDGRRRRRAAGLGAKAVCAEAQGATAHGDGDDPRQDPHDRLPIRGDAARRTPHRSSVGFVTCVFRRGHTVTAAPRKWAVMPSVGADQGRAVRSLRA